MDISWSKQMLNVWIWHLISAVTVQKSTNSADQQTKLWKCAYCNFCSKFKSALRGHHKKRHNSKKLFIDDVSTLTDNQSVRIVINSASQPKTLSLITTFCTIRRYQVIHENGNIGIGWKMEAINLILETFIFG